MDRARFFVRGLQKARLQEPRDPGSSLQAEARIDRDSGDDYDDDDEDWYVHEHKPCSKSRPQVGTPPAINFAAIIHTAIVVAVVVASGVIVIVLIFVAIGSREQGLQ